MQRGSTIFWENVGKNFRNYFGSSKRLKKALFGIITHAQQNKQHYLHMQSNIVVPSCFLWRTGFPSQFQWKLKKAKQNRSTKLKYFVTWKGKVLFNSRIYCKNRNMQNEVEVVQYAWSACADVNTCESKQ